MTNVLEGFLVVDIVDVVGDIDIFTSATGTAHIIVNIGHVVHEGDMVCLEQLEGFMVEYIYPRVVRCNSPRWAWSVRACFWTSAVLGLFDWPSVFSHDLSFHQPYACPA